MAFETAEMIARAGAEIALRSRMADGRARAVVMICHGLAEHAGRYGRFAAFLAARGYHVYAHDHRGHGSTTAPDAPLGRFAAKDGAAKVLDDVAAIRALVAERHPGLPVALFGHSMGGMIAMNAVQERPRDYAALAIFNSKLNPGAAGALGTLAIKAERFFKGSDVPSMIGPKATFDAWAKSIPHARTDFDWLSHDAAEVDAYVADPRCGFAASVSLWLDLMTLSRQGGDPSRLARLPPDLPVYLVGGGEDPATARGADMIWLENRLRKSGANRLTTVVYRNMRHETLNEIGRDEAMRNFVAWLDAVISANQPGTDTAP
ncbi:alpha/beta fold hydrolase [Rhizobium sp. TRM95796]|uniref:alpha/beta fold hydrolase n=1 Tax=Rhizobium sp. TRM95796 TaxID=2979862 RepID=UPI0021E7597A|nr:alpha/beta hydrolase [Rhizobium sp. TRM95796]MCV3764645.1 alpha/beta hydrolase [Rhizobium sp. TRM95796]